MSDDKEFLDKLKLDLEEIGLYDSLDGEVSLLDLAKNFSRAAEHYRELIEEAIDIIEDSDDNHEIARYKQAIAGYIKKIDRYSANAVVLRELHYEK
jgi:hypothetical protein